MHYSHGYRMVHTTSLGALNRQIFAKPRQTCIHTYMTQAHFLSIVGLRLRALGAQPPSELANSYTFYTGRGISFRAHVQLYTNLSTSIRSPSFIVQEAPYWYF